MRSAFIAFGDLIIRFCLKLFCPLLCKSYHLMQSVNCLCYSSQECLFIVMYVLYDTLCSVFECFYGKNVCLAVLAMHVDFVLLYSCFFFAIKLVRDNQARLGENVTAVDLFAPAHTPEIWSSRPNAWFVCLAIQAWQSGRPSSPDRANAPPCMQVDTSSYAHACGVRPSREPYLRRQSVSP